MSTMEAGREQGLAARGVHTSKAVSEFARRGAYEHAVRPATGPRQPSRGPLVCRTGAHTALAQRQVRRAGAVGDARTHLVGQGGTARWSRRTSTC